MLRRRDQGLHKHPFGISQVARVTKATAVRGYAVFGLPHPPPDRIKRPTMNHIRFCRFKNFSDRLSERCEASAACLPGLALPCRIACTRCRAASCGAFNPGQRLKICGKTATFTWSGVRGCWISDRTPRPTTALIRRPDDSSLNRSTRRSRAVPSRSSAFASTAMLHFRGSRGRWLEVVITFIFRSAGLFRLAPSPVGCQRRATEGRWCVLGS